MSCVTLRFQYPSGSPAAEEEVAVIGPAGVPSERLRTASDGTVEIPSDDGVVTFRVGTPPEGPFRWSAGAPTNFTLRSSAGELVRMYGQLVDREGQPAAGVGMALVVAGKGVTLASTDSDPNGAFVLSFPAVRDSIAPPERNGDTDEERDEGDDTATKYQLELSVNENPIELPGLAAQPPGPYGPHSFVVDRQPPADGRVAPPPMLMDGEAELLGAVKAAPQLAAQPTGAGRPNPCAPRPSLDFPARVFYLQQFAMYPPGDDDVMSTTGYRESSAPLRYGAIVEHRQEWWDLGYALGDLLYSVPLAPCEQVKLATIDWRRRDWAKSRTGVDEYHWQDTTINRDTTVDEAVTMTATKGVASLTAGGGGALSLGLINVGQGYLIQGAAELTNASTTASSRINDSIQQTSTTLRNTRSYAITEVTQEEETSVATRTVRNHNHSHTLTFQYFEVLRRFKISTRPVKIRPAVFVRFPLIHFTEQTLLQHGYLLRRALLDPTLERVLDTFLAGDILTGADTTEDVEEPAAPTGSIARVNLIADSPQISYSPKIQLILNDKLIKVDFKWPTNREDGRSTLTTDHPGGTPASALGVATLEGIRKVGVYYGGVNHGSTPSDAVLEDLEIVAEASDGATRTLLRQDELTLPWKRRHVEYIGEDSSGAAPIPASKRSVDLGRLLVHLNAYQAYYSAAIHTAGDAGLRWMKLQQIQAGGNSTLADKIENTVVGSVGDYLAFPLLDDGELPEWARITDNSWMFAKPDERLVSLPSPGVFAEAQLGSCPASEKIDNTRFWQWHRAPCPDEAPDITDAMVGSRFQNPTGLIQPVTSTLQPSPVQIPELPKPMIEIGDATLAELVKGVELPDADALLGLVEGLSKLSSEGFDKLLDKLIEYGAKAAMAAAGVPDVSGAVEATGAAAEGLSSTSTTAPTP